MTIPFIPVGCTFASWKRQVLANRRSVSLSAMAVLTPVSALNSLLSVVERIAYGRRLRNIKLCEPPVIVIGHWRSGTTLLHELLALDRNASFPNNYCCFAPAHFLLTEKWWGPHFDLFAPWTRPMDSMSIGWDYPQEDEIAMLGLGAESSYWSFVFPDSRGLPVSLVDKNRRDKDWDRLFADWVTRLAYRENKRLVLKSPSHSFHILRLQRILPGARFVYITRDDQEVVDSTIRLHDRMQKQNVMRTATQSISVQAVRQGIEELQTAVALAKPQLMLSQFCEVHFEDLIASPRQVMRGIYAQLELPGFDEAWPRISSRILLGTGSDA